MMNREITYSRQHRFGQLRRLAQIEPRRQRRNLILVEPAAQVAGATEATGDDARDATERLVRTRSAEHVAVLRVAVEIEHEEAQATRLALRQAPVALHQLFEVRPSQQSGELVVTQVGQPGLR